MTTGPRRAEGSTDADAMVEVEVPLLATRKRRGDLAAALDEKAEAMRVSARGIALADLSAAYARAWLAQTEAELREEDIEVVDDWLAATERRVEAGADPPYESILIAGERDRAMLDLLAARREVELAWGELARLSAIAESSQPVDLATLPGARDGDATLEGSSETVLAGIDARRELIALLARAHTAAASSRWAIAGDAGREGDERLARVGFAYRFPLGGERASIAELERAAEAAAAGEAAADRGEVRARLAAARTALAATGPGLGGRRLRSGAARSRRPYRRRQGTRIGGAAAAPSAPRSRARARAGRGLTRPGPRRALLSRRRQPAMKAAITSPVALLLALLAPFTLTSCGARSSEEPHAEHDEGHAAEEDHGDVHTDAEENGNGVPLEGVRGVSFAAVNPPVEEGVWYPAEAEAAADERAMLTSPVGGVVIAIKAAPGREVGAGAPLLTVRSPELAELAAAVLETEAERAQAATEVAREERLARANAGAARELEAAKTALAVAEAESGRGAVGARGTRHSGRSGQADPRRARPLSRSRRGVRRAGRRGGRLPGSASGCSRPRAHRWCASSCRSPVLRPGSRTPRPWCGAATARPGRARVEGLPASLTAETRRLTYHLRIEGDEPPYPGTPLEARVPLPPGIVVPQDAVQQIEGQWGIFVIEGDGAHAQARFAPIRRGPELGGDVIVLEGVEPGQRIATEGAYLLKALALKRSGGGEAHAH